MSGEHLASGNYTVVTAPLGNRFIAHSAEEVEHFRTIWTVTEVIP